MSILSIAGYQFIALNEIKILRQTLLERCHALSLKGTILLSTEGMNLNLAGMVKDIEIFKLALKKEFGFQITFRESYPEYVPFKRLKVKLKKEIITLRQENVNLVNRKAPSLTPEIFKTWLDEKYDITILDARNDYEIQFGTFTHAINLHLNHFNEFPAAIQAIPSDKPIVMFCTGGIRCEKAAIYLLNKGFKNVYQLEGGILNYFEKVGGAHYTGECFVFDERIAVDANLNPVKS